MKKLQLKYRTFDELLADVMIDFTNYSLENLIEPQQLIKEAKRVTKDLGLKIFKTKEDILELNHNRAKLPDDFYVFNSGVMCGEYSVSTIMPQGITTMEVPYPRYKDINANINVCASDCPVEEKSCGGCGTCNKCVTDEVVVPGFNPLLPYGDPCVKPRVFMDCKGGSWELIQIVNTQTRHYKQFMPLHLVSADCHFDNDCPNRNVQCDNRIWVKDGFLHSNMRNGKIYICYEGNMEDEEGNLLVLDHDSINGYYEYSLKAKILENLWMNNEDVERKLAFVKQEVRLARINAWTIVRTPDFSEMQENFVANRRRYNARYVDMFKSYDWLYDLNWTYGRRR